MTCVHCGADLPDGPWQSMRKRCERCARKRRTTPRQSDRAQHFADMFKSGLTLQEIGDQYGLSRERVRQILASVGVTRAQGGEALRARRRREKRDAERDQRTLARYGCTWAQLKEIRAHEGAPHRAYFYQRKNSRNRGIPFEMTLWEWWSIWKESGHWHERGRGQGYCMCRKNDEGPYSVDNVFIAPSRVNSSLAQRRRDPSLPMGVQEVQRAAGTRYLASRMIQGQNYYLGTYRTPTEAAAAYEAAGASR